MNILEFIKSRRSIRQFSDQPVSDEVINKIIEAGTWAPSGKNNQPWKFAVIKDSDLKAKMSGLTHYSKVISGASVLIAVFLDDSLSYDRTKDIQAVGACMQNMLLYIHAIGLGAVWLGQILQNKEKVLELLQGPKNLELMAVIALGYPATKGGRGNRKEVHETIFFRK